MCFSSKFSANSCEVFACLTLMTLQAAVSVMMVEGKDLLAPHDLSIIKKVSNRQVVPNLCLDPLRIGLSGSDPTDVSHPVEMPAGAVDYVPLIPMDTQFEGLDLPDADFVGCCSRCSRFGLENTSRGRIFRAEEYAEYA